MIGSYHVHGWWMFNNFKYNTLTSYVVRLHRAVFMRLCTFLSLLLRCIVSEMWQFSVSSVSGYTHVLIQHFRVIATQPVVSSCAEIFASRTCDYFCILFFYTSFLWRVTNNKSCCFHGGIASSIWSLIKVGPWQLQPISVKLHLRDGRTDGRTVCPSIRQSLRWSLTLKSHKYVCIITYQPWHEI